MQNFELQSLLSIACEGTSVTVRELIKVLSIEEITMIKSGDLTLDDLKEIVCDIADSQRNRSH